MIEMKIDEFKRSYNEGCKDPIRLISNFGLKNTIERLILDLRIINKWLNNLLIFDKDKQVNIFKEITSHKGKKRKFKN